MAVSLNKVTLIGNLGRDPEIRSMNNGGEVATLNIATSESWNDKATGERRDKTEWHRVVIFKEGLIGIVKSYLKKGHRVYIEGQLQTRKWLDSNGQEKYTTEVVLQGFNANLILLDGTRSQDPASSGKTQDKSPVSFENNELDDEIPF